MITQLKIRFNAGKEWKVVKFGLTSTDKEKEQMFKLRHKVYLKHKYIDEVKSGVEMDEYDNERSTYFIATIDDKIIGSVRLIRDEFLPTEKECFEFTEPKEMSIIRRNKRCELGRLIVDRQDYDLPRHIIMLGLINTVTEHALKEGIEGGYSFIKNSLKIKLDKLKFPFHDIRPFKQVYSKGVLLPYFQDKNDIVYPVFYLVSETKEYLNKLFGNKLMFKEEGDGTIKLKNNLIYKLLNLFNASTK